MGGVGSRQTYSFHLKCGEEVGQSSSVLLTARSFSVPWGMGMALRLWALRGRPGSYELFWPMNLKPKGQVTAGALTPRRPLPLMPWAQAL